MTITYIVVGACLALFLLMAALAKGSRPPARKRVDPAAYRRASVMTDNEREFHGRLLAALPDGLELWTQTPLLALVQPLPGSDYQSAKGRLTNQRTDWTIACDGVVQIVIELDDASHATKRDRDADRDTLLRSCGYGVLRYESRDRPNVRRLASDIADALKRPPASGRRRARG